MKYKKISMAFERYENRFFRTVLVPENINLVDLGCVLCTAAGAEFEHHFLFDVPSGVSYVPDIFLEYGDMEKDQPMKKYTLAALGEKFDFTYDTGDFWNFKCNVGKHAEEKNEGETAYLTGGAGQGIWEDNSYTLRMYLDGELPGDMDTEDADQGIFFPWNVEIEKLSDFDTAFVLEDAAFEFGSRCRTNIEMYKENMQGNSGDSSESEDELQVMDLDVTAGNAVSYIKASALELAGQDKDVHAVFLRLQEKYGDDTALNMISAVIAENAFDVLSGNQPEDPAYYRTRIEKLK